MSTPVEFSAEQGVGTLRLVRPERRNALGHELASAGISAVGAMVDAGVTIATLEADGPVFCAGADISPAEREWQDGPTGDDFVRSVAQAPIFWVAVVQGPAVGSGAALVAACPVALCAASSWFALPERKYGEFPEFAVSYVAAVIGIRRTIDLLASGRRMDATDAAAAGLATAVVADEELAESKATWMRDLAENPGFTEQLHTSWVTTVGAAWR